MTPSELNKIHAGSTVRPEVGATVAVGLIYDRLRQLADNQKKLAQVRNQLRAVADLLEPLEGVVGCDAQEGIEGNTEPS
jgi:hypothetical protein